MTGLWPVNSGISIAAKVTPGEKSGHHVDNLLDGEHHEGDHHQLQVLLQGRQLLLPSLCYRHLRLS